MANSKVRIQHRPTGAEVTCDYSRSIHRMKLSCQDMIRGKVWSIMHGGYPEIADTLVRSYTDQDFDRLDIVDMGQERRKP